LTASCSAIAPSDGTQNRSGTIEYLAEYSFTDAVRCRITWRAMNTGSRMRNLNSIISYGVVCLWRIR